MRPVAHCLSWTFRKRGGRGDIEYRSPFAGQTIRSQVIDSGEYLAGGLVMRNTRSASPIILLVILTGVAERHGDMLGIEYAADDL